MKRRAWNSSLPAPTAPLARSRKPIRARGIAKAKKEARYKAFLSSAAWKRLRRAALERAGHRCEWITWGFERGEVPAAAAFMELARCPATERLTVHHVTYSRFGGKELPEDLRVLCKSCHDTHHALEGKRLAHLGGAA